MTPTAGLGAATRSLRAQVRPDGLASQPKGSAFRNKMISPKPDELRRVYEAAVRQ